MIRSRLASAVAVSLIVVLPTAGCYQGFDGTVNSQGPTGNGTDFTVPPEDGVLQVQDVTLVASPEDPSTANLIMTVINDGPTPDALVSATVGSAQGATGPVAVEPGQAVRIGGPGGEPAIAVDGLTTPLGSYETVTLSFRDAGSVDAAVLIVPAVGYYEDYAPTAKESAGQSGKDAGQSGKDAEQSGKDAEQSGKDAGQSGTESAEQ